MGNSVRSNDLSATASSYVPGSPENPYGYSTSPTRPKPANYTPPQFNNVGNVYYTYNGGQQRQGGMYRYNSKGSPTNTGWYGTDYTNAINALNQSSGKYLLGSKTFKPGQFGYDYDDRRTAKGAPQTIYFLYDNPNYQAPPPPAPTPAPAPTPTYTTDANKKPVNNGTTAGTMSSVIKLNPHQQYLLNQQNAAKQQLTNALADYAKKVFNSSYQPEKSEATRLRTFSEVMRELNKTDLSGAFSTARDFVNKTNDVYNTAAEQYKKAMAKGAPKSDWAYRKQIQDALMDYQESRLNPTYAKQADDLAVKLANQGITQGSNAYGSEWDIYHRAKNDAYQSAYNNAITLGEQAIQNQFNRDMETYKQYANNYDLAAKYRDAAGDNLNNVYSLDVQQNAALNNSAIGLMNAYSANQQRAQQKALETRQQQLNELMSLMQLTAPTMPTFSNQQTAGNVAPGDYIGAATGLYGGLGGAAANGAAQQQAAQQSRNNFFGDLIGAGTVFGLGKLFGL